MLSTSALKYALTLVLVATQFSQSNASDETPSTILNLLKKLKNSRSSEKSYVQTVSANDVAELLEKLIQDEGIEEDEDLGSLSKLLATHNEIFDSQTSCSMDWNKKLIRLLVKYHLTPLGLFIDTLREKQKSYCWHTYGARLAQQIDLVDVDTFKIVNEFARNSPILPSDVIFSIDNLSESVVEETIERLSNSKVFNYNKNNARDMLNSACDQQINNYKMRDYLWMLRIIERPKLDNQTRQFLFAAKLCLSLLEISQRAGKANSTKPNIRPTKFGKTKRADNF